VAALHASALKLEEEFMSEEETKATAAPKKPRAKKAVNAEGPAKPASAKRTTGANSGEAAPKRKAAAKAPEKPAEQTPTPNSAVLVSSGVAAAGATVAAQSTNAFHAVSEKVSAMIPEDMGGKAKDVASDVKDMACDAVNSVAQILKDSADAIDDNIGPKYGDYARSAAQSVTDAAERLRAKPVDEIADETREFVRNKPVAAAGIAAVAGLVIAKILSSVFGKRR
jgi:ElaB/YqjD/DUF883 family membrane-anchored ribosome-binding protein